ncbi:hypothetical protein CH231_15855, partial [Salmonella enterica subsp. enterica serovar Typhimurium]
KERLIGIFVDGDFFPGQKDAFSKLEYDYENIKVIYRNKFIWKIFLSKSPCQKKKGIVIYCSY